MGEKHLEILQYVNYNYIIDYKILTRPVKACLFIIYQRPIQKKNLHISISNFIKNYFEKLQSDHTAMSEDLQYTCIYVLLKRLHIYWNQEKI